MPFPFRKEPMMSTSPEKNEGPKPEKEKKKKNGDAPARKLKVSPKLALVQDVILLMNDADISELAFEQGGVKIHLRRGPGMPFAAAPAVSSVSVASAPAAAGPPAPGAPAPAAAGALAAKSDNTVTLNSPMVGTFYRAPSPDAKPFVEEGDKVTVGQVYCIVEAMKLMNEVKAEVNGKVVKILVQNGQAVEFNQPLLIIDPS
jgi:oxaloacetate decarboxylase (Na+ extruding) subunit alpha